METQKELKDTEGFDWLESTELAIDKRKFLLNRLYQQQPIPQDEDFVITLNKDDDFNVESCCVTSDARHPRVCLRKNKDT